MKRYFRIEKTGVVGSWCSKLVGTAFVLLSEYESENHYVTVQVGSKALFVLKTAGSIITEKDLTYEELRTLNSINDNV